jgi:ribosomal protein L37E
MKSIGHLFGRLADTSTPWCPPREIACARCGAKAVTQAKNTLYCAACRHAVQLKRSEKWNRKLAAARKAKRVK